MDKKGAIKLNKLSPVEEAAIGDASLDLDFKKNLRF